MNKLLPGIIGLIIVAGVGAFALFQMQSRSVATRDTTNPSEVMQTSEATSTTPTASGQTYSVAEVATHKDASSCWTIIDGVVYDLTQWIGRHPGGERAILGICGIDGTAAFRGQHDHRAKQEAILATFKIGTLAQ